MTSAPSPIWQFTTPPAARRATVVLAAFAPAEVAAALADVPAAAPFAVRVVARADDPAWFDAWRAGSLRAIAERDLGADGLAELDRAGVVALLAATIDAPTDLGYLQVAWGLARALADVGAAIVLDAHAMRYVRAAAIAPADARLDVGREVQIVFETDSTRSDRAHALHTRGMIKFGAPDLVALCTDDDADLVGRVLAQLAAQVARGAELDDPRHQLALAPTESWFVVPDTHGLADLLQLNNAARVLVDAEGKHLLGVAARLRDR